MDIIYDIETYANCFTFAAEGADSPFKWSFQISTYQDDTTDFIDFLRALSEGNHRLVGFNNLAFDWPIVDKIARRELKTPNEIFQYAQRIIQSENKFEFFTKPSDRGIEQLDLLKINHFDNKARMTSLKALEFSMKLDNISDLPFPIGATLTPEQILKLKAYNAHDVHATKKFYQRNLEQIRFREGLTAKHGRDFLNHNDTKIGAEIFQMELENAGVQCYEYGSEGRKPRQTIRPCIKLIDCIPEWIAFNHFEFNRIKYWMQQQTITETKGIFKDVKAHVGGLDFIFGTGGIHASVESKSFMADDQMMILDVDVASLYPSIAIANGYYPEHLGKKFVDVYADLRQQRMSFKKGTVENAALKLALNGTYGKSNDKFSIFYDPLFTMKITIGGQLMLAMLAERLLAIPNVRIIQCNTDGITMYLPRNEEQIVTNICEEWEVLTKLELEYVEYSKMFIRDVNNYIAVGVDGKVKRKGAYEYDLEWHQNASMLVVPKVAERVLVYGEPLRDTILNWPDKLDFMGRVKIPRGSRLELADGMPLENTQRYYISKGGKQMIKIMPPLKGKTEYRRFNVESGWGACPCNDIRDATMDIDYNYYIQETEKLCLNVL